MKKKIIILLIITILFSYSRKLFYLEEFYQIYYLPHKAENDDYLRNIHWLKFALTRPFSPPIYALSPPKNELEYNRYKKLMKMHLHYLIVKNTVYLAARFDKFKKVFYNKPYREDIYKSIDIAEYLYIGALNDWKIVISYFDEVKETKQRTSLEFLEKMVYRIQINDLNYKRIINRRLIEIAKIRDYFK